mgnify:CR=1 FL=1
MNTIPNKKLSLEAKAEALLKRLQRYNLTRASLSEFEIKSVLKQIRIIGTQNLAGYASHATLERISRIMEQAVAEAKKILQK